METKTFILDAINRCTKFNTNEFILLNIKHCSFTAVYLYDVTCDVFHHLSNIICSSPLYVI